MAGAADKQQTIALCLSGGGFRATLFHLGVIRALRATEFAGRRAIEAVSEVYSVSGGSILAAHMLVNWDAYAGEDDEAYRRVEDELKAFAMRNVRDRVLRRAAVTAAPLFLQRKISSHPVWGRTFWLRRAYEQLLGPVTFADCYAAAGVPTMHLLATSFRSGELCSFSGDRLEVERGDQPRFETSCGHLRLSLAVAASSAFPPMFPPIVLSDDTLANPTDRAFPEGLLLSDGGVYDNVGIEKFRRRRSARRTTAQTVLISNAGGSFRASVTKSYAGALPRNIRASDILMHRVADNTEDAISKMRTVDDICVRLSTEVPNSDLHETVQRRLKLVRTDLDRFDPELAGLLVDHGERVTRHELGAAGMRAKGWFPLNEARPAGGSGADIERLNRVTAKAAERSFRWLPFAWDWPLLILWPAALAAAGLVVVPTAGYVQSQIEQTARLREYEGTLKEAQRAASQNNMPRLREILAVAIEDAQEEVESSSEASPVPQPSVAIQPEAQAYPQRVFIQFAGNLTRGQIVALNQALKNARWNVQGDSGERIGTAEGLNEVRFSGDNRMAAQALADAISDARITSSRVGVREVRIIGGDALEAWISG